MPETTAYHEAGHVVMAVLAGARVRSVTITPDRDDGPNRFGDTEVAWDLSLYSKREFLEHAIRVALAGPVAEMIYHRKPYHPGLVSEWSADWQEAWRSAEELIADETQRLRYLERVTVHVYQQLDRDDRWAALAAVVDNLLAHERLESEELEEILAAWL